jgi:hypothetical protein
MAIYLGTAGLIQLIRTSIADGLTATVNPSDVNTSRSRFSFEFPVGSLLTGDYVTFKTTDGSTLDFVATTGWSSGVRYSDGNWFVNVDGLGSIRLYSTFDDAVAGEIAGSISLSSIARNIPITATVFNKIPRVVGNLERYEISTDRETVDTSSLGDEFRNNYGTMITGSGQMSCIFDYRYSQTSSYPGAAGYVELASYMHALILRQQFGAEFQAKLFLISNGKGQGAGASNDEVWFEIDGIITQASVAFDPGQIVSSVFNFICTGEIRLKIITDPPSDYLLKQDGAKLKLEDGNGTLLLEQKNG